MEIINATISSSWIPLGYQGENHSRQIVFDIADWQKQYGFGTVLLAHQRGGDTQPYPVAVTVEGSKAIWTVQSADVAVAGNNGHCQLSYLVDDKVVKSFRCRTEVSPSADATGDTPEPYVAWMDAMQSYVEAHAVPGEKGERGEKGEPFTYADFTQEQLSLLKGDKGDKGETGEKGEKGEAGADGQDGQDGVDGKSAYELAVASGYVGTLAEWLTSLQGADAPSGEMKLKIVGNAQTPDADGYVHVPGASSQQYGVVKVNANNGVKTSSGALVLALANKSNIDMHAVTGYTIYTPIGVQQIDYAVKVAMCDGRGAAWTDAERLAALLRMGCTVDDDGTVKCTARGGTK